MIFIGVDVSLYSVKAVAVRASGKKWQILNTHFFPIQPAENRQRQIALKWEYLKDLSHLYKDQEVKYIFSFPQNIISAHTIQFPFKERHKMMKSLPFEIEDNTLFDYKNLISDIKITHLEEDKSETLVFSVLRKNIIDTLQRLKAVDISPFILTCEAECMANILESSDKKKKSPKSSEKNYELYLKIGYEYTVAGVFIQNRLRNVYSFGWGVLSCIKKIAHKYEIPIKTAFEQFHEKAFVLTSKRGYTGSQIVFSDLIQEAFNHLIQKIRLLLLKQTGEQNLICQKILIYGEGAQIRNLQALLSSRLDVPVVRVENIPVYPDWNLRDNEQNQNNLAIALGAALEGMKKLRNPAINFLREEFAVKFNPFTFLSPQWRQILVMGGIVLTLLVSYVYFKNRQSVQLAEGIHPFFKKYSAYMARLPSHKVNIPRLRQFIDSKKNLIKQAQLADELSGIPSALDSIKDISVAVRKQLYWDLQIKKLNIQNKKIKIYGTISKPYLKEFEKSLKNSAKKGLLKSIPADLMEKSHGNKSKAVTEDHNKISFAYLFIQA